MERCPFFCGSDLQLRGVKLLVASFAIIRV